MRDMMAQIRDCGDGIRDGTYTMTAPKITGGTITGSTINNSAIGGTTAAAGAFTTLSATGVTTVQAGTVSLPAITTTGDTNTGIFFPAADTIAFTEGGVESMRIDSSGNVGIGTSSPTSRLHVSGAILASGGNGITATSGFVADRSGSEGFLVLQQSSAGGGQIRSVSAGGLRFTDNGASTEWMRIDSSGNLLIGTTSASGFDSGADNLIVGGGSGSNGITIYSGNTSTAGINFADGTTGSAIYAGGITYNHNTNNLDFSTTDGSGRMRIDASGNVLVGKTSFSDSVVGIQLPNSGLPTFTASQSTSAASTLNIYSTGASAYRFYVNMAGTVFATNTTISGISDQRLKENIVDLDDGLNAVMALKPRKFDWKEGKGKNIKGDRGFIAQEFETVFPDMIEEWKDPAPEGEEPYKSVNANLIPTLVKAIQEQQALIENLTTRLNALEGN
jgi:hypothetical protein